MGDILAPIRETLLIFAAAGALYVAVMLWLRPWRAPNRDDSTPLWKFLFLGFGYKLRRHEGVAAISWALLISGAVVAWGYLQYAQMAQILLMLDPDGPYGYLHLRLLTSLQPVVDISLGVEAGSACNAVQIAGSEPMTRCTLEAIDGQTTLRLNGFDLTCEVTCRGDDGWNRTWEYSRGPLPSGSEPSPSGHDI